MRTRIHHIAPLHLPPFKKRKENLCRNCKREDHSLHGIMGCINAVSATEGLDFICKCAARREFERDR